MSVLQSIQQHLENYQKLTSQGKLAQAGQELEAIRQETRKALGKSGAPKKPAGKKKPVQQKPPRRPN